LAGLAREWREQLPKLGRLNLQITRERHGLTIKELRAGATDFHAINWDPGAHEPDITIMQLDLIIAPRKFKFEINNIAAASIHAVGRHFQRKIGEVDDKSVLRELHTMAVWYLKLPEHRPGQQFEIDGWRGDMVDVGQRELVASVRTYLDADA
jgi:hypothetical protein